MYEEMIQRMETTENILCGLKNYEFMLYLQFIVDNKTKKIVIYDGATVVGSAKIDEIKVIAVI